MFHLEDPHLEVILLLEVPPIAKASRMLIDFIVL
jgi:hypothetical protein